MKLNTKDWVLEQHQKEIIEFIESLITKFGSWKDGEIWLKPSGMFYLYDLEIALERLKDQQKINYCNNTGTQVLKIWIDNLNIDCEYSLYRKNTDFNPETINKP